MGSFNDQLRLNLATKIMTRHRVKTKPLASKVHWDAVKCIVFLNSKLMWQ